MCVTNFMFQQNVNYTYKQGDKKSYIDHVIIPTYLCDSVVECKILDNVEDNTLYILHIYI